MPVIDTVLRDRVLIARIDNRSANALTSEMAGQLEGIAHDAGQNPDVGALLLTGSRGGHFCAGSDIAELSRLEEEGLGPGPLLEAEAAAFSALAAMDLPTIAAIDGAAAGGGLELAVCCDLIVASRRAQFSLPEIRLGVFPALGGTVRLVRRIGEPRALELMLTGDSLDGETARDWGLVNRLAPDGLAFRHAFAMARTLAHGPRNAITQMKSALTANRAMPEAEALSFALMIAKSNAGSAEVAEGLRAFIAGETPDFVSARSRAARPPG